MPSRRAVLTRPTVTMGGGYICVRVCWLLLHVSKIRTLPSKVVGEDFHILRAGFRFTEIDRHIIAKLINITDCESIDCLRPYGVCESVMFN
jgi:hypothetical protein